MSSPALQLYGANGACSLATHIVLEETNTPFTYTPFTKTADGNGMEGPGGVPSYAEFLRINPKGYVPTLRVKGAGASGSDVIITEGAALFTYIITAAGRGDELLGATPLARAQIAEWLVWLGGTLHGSGFGAMWRPARFAGEEKAAAETVAAVGRKTVIKGYEMIEAQVGEKYAYGDAWSVVDAYIYVFYRWGPRVGLDMTKEYPRLTAVMRVTEARESVRKSLEGEGLPTFF